MTVKQLREQRARLIAEARSHYDVATKDGRTPTAEDEAKFKGYMDEADKVEARAVEAERLETAERSLAESRGRASEGEQPGRVPGSETRQDRHASAEYRSMVQAYLRGGWEDCGPTERRALQADNDVVGGYLTAPQQMVSDLIKAVDNMVWLRGLATKYTVTTAHSLGIPSLDADPADATWTTELATGTADSTMAFGKRELAPHPLAKSIKVSEKLLRMTDVETLVCARLAYKFGVTEEQAFMTGTGNKQPLGLFVDSNDGIPTSRDVSTDNTTTAMTPDGLLNAKYSLKPQYQKVAKWLFHRDGVKMIRKFKDGQNQYIWSPGFSGQTDTLFDTPVIQSEYVPNTFTTGLYVGMIGDFSNYAIADCTALTIKRLVELYAETAQIGFIGRMEVDGMPILSEAFARITLA